MKAAEKFLTVTAELIPEADGGYTVWCPELDIYTQGETEEECIANLREAAALHMEELGQENIVLRAIKRQEVKIRLHA